MVHVVMVMMMMMGVVHVQLHGLTEKEALIKLFIGHCTIRILKVRTGRYGGRRTRREAPMCQQIRSLYASNLKQPSSLYKYT